MKQYSAIDIIKIILGISAIGMGGGATYNVGNAANAIFEVKQELKETRQEMKEVRKEISKVNNIVTEAITIQSISVKDIADLKIRVRELEQKQH